ncbi:MAG: glycosyltransferase family 9 protein [Sphingomonadales bacterium]
MTANSEKWLYFFNLLLSRMVNVGKRPDNINPDKILIIKWDELGDLVTATNVFSLLRARFPRAYIELITKPANIPLVQFDTNLDCISPKIESWKGRYDLHIELRGTWKSFFRTFRYMPGYRLDRGWVRFLQRGNQPHETITNYRIVAPVLGDMPMHKPYVAIKEADETAVSSYLKKVGAEKFIVYHTGARKALRRWPATHFAALADYTYQTFNLSSIFVGTPEELPQIEAITKLMQTPAVVAADKMSITELAALISKAYAFVGNESGPLQIADAMGVRSLSFFGPGVKDVFYPQHPQSLVIHKILPCNPCDQVHCIHPDNPCINRITIEEAINAIGVILRS